jgi:cation transport ATPase
MASSEPTQKTFKVAITTKMLCQGCADTIKVVTEQVHYIKHTSVNLNTQSAEITAVIGACICEPDGNGNMPKCLCIEKGIVSAVQSAGFESVISPCRGPDGVARQPCVAAQSGRRRFVFSSFRRAQRAAARPGTSSAPAGPTASAATTASAAAARPGARCPNRATTTS